MSEALLVQEEGLKSLEPYFSHVSCMSTRAHIRRVDRDDAVRCFVVEFGDLIGLLELPRGV